MSRNGRPASICVTNAKGGTGKTTVAGALNERGHDVLFVDLDPQGNATEELGLVDAYDAQPQTVFDVVTDPSSREAVGDIVVSHPEMDIVPSNVDMLRAERELTLANVMARLAADPDADTDRAALAPLTVNVSPATVTGDHALDTLDRALAALPASTTMS